jgi:hypothetical protein
VSETKTIFNGENYDEWEAAMLFHLRSKALAGALTKPRPSEGAAKQDKWDTSNEQAMGKIGERILPKYYEFVRNCTTAKEMYDKIKEIAQSTNVNLARRYRRRIRRDINFGTRRRSPTYRQARKKPKNLEWHKGAYY